jgi:hypothetical protein
MEKEIFALIGILFMLASYSIYIYSIFKGETRPHPFSWFIWGLLTAIGFFAQMSDGAGVGAIITALSAIISFFIAGIGYIKREHITISKSDKWAFILSLTAIPLWMITQTPLWSVILITLIDGAGFYPTFRKSWYFPKQESSLSYTLGGFKHFFTIMALEHYSITTALFPFSLVLTNFTLIAMIFYRKRILNNDTK